MKILGSYALSIAAIAIAIFCYTTTHENDNNNHDMHDKKSHKHLSAMDVEKIAEDVIMKNPKLILESVERMHEKREEEKMQKIIDLIKAKEMDFKNDRTSPSMGPQDAKVTIVEFFDYNCGYCRKMLQVKKDLLKNFQDVRILFKDLPIMGNASVVAAKSAIAVHLIDPTKYFDYHSMIMNYKGAPTAEALKGFAVSLGIDENKYSKTLLDPRVMKTIESNMMLANQLEIRGTPAYIIGNEFVPSAMSYSMMAERITAFMKKQKESSTSSASSMSQDQEMANDANAPKNNIPTSHDEKMADDAQMPKDTAMMADSATGAATDIADQSANH